VKIEEGRRVRLKAMLKVAGGDVIEKSVVEYFQGAGTMLPGLERELAGLEKGATKKGVIKAADAFGTPTMQPKKEIPRAEFPKEATLGKGERFEARGANGQPVVLEIQKSDDQTVECRLVHPLADKDIEYEVEVLSVTDPAPPPLPADAIGASDSDD
jgi:FKBP-type peptidyl-prolyl cis-trans isomerase 2